MRILPVDWTAVPKRPLPIVAEVPDDKSGRSCATCIYRVKNNTMLGPVGISTIALAGGFCRRHGWTYPSEYDQLLYRCEDHDDQQVRDCLEDPPVLRCSECHHVRKAHDGLVRDGKASRKRCTGMIVTAAGQLTRCECMKFQPGQPTLAQVLAYCGMDLKTFAYWCTLNSLDSLGDMPAKLLRRYLSEFGPDHDDSSFIDWILVTLKGNQPSWDLRHWYEGRFRSLQAEYDEGLTRLQHALQEKKR